MTHPTPTREAQAREVIQADWDAAEPFFPDLAKRGARRGDYDGSDLVQAFAAHRLAFASPLQGEREAIARVEQFISLIWPQLPLSTRRNMLPEKESIDAILALSPTVSSKTGEE